MTTAAIQIEPALTTSAPINERNLSFILVSSCPVESRDHTSVARREKVRRQKICIKIAVMDAHLISRRGMVKAIGAVAGAALAGDSLLAQRSTPPTVI